MDDVPAAVSETEVSCVSKEVNLNSSLPRIGDNNADPLIWWNKNRETFPILSKMARKYLCVMATSVPSERLFSAAGSIVSARRNTLKPAKVNSAFWQQILNTDTHSFLHALYLGVQSLVT